MLNKTIFWTILLIIFVKVLDCNGDVCTCQCCTGKSCKPAFQGSVIVPECTSASCRSICRSRYPQRCVDNSNSTFHQCTINHGLPTPDWTGVFDIKGSCDTQACCCPEGQAAVWRISTTQLRVQLIVVGSACNGSTSFDHVLLVPISFGLQVSFFGQIIEFQLSQDSNTIQLINPTTPVCNANANRHEPPPISSAVIQSASMFLLFFLISLKKLIL